MRLFLSRLTLNPNRRSDNIITAPAYAHQAVLSCFPDDITPEQKHVLYRVENEYVLALSRLPASSGLMWKNIFSGVDSKVIEPVIVRGQQYRFKLRANPGSRINNGPRNGEEVQAWFEGRALQHGFVCDPRSVNYGAIFCREVKNFSIAQVDIAGILTVTDPVKFEDAVINGIGRGKAYGCGLLTVAPV